MRIVGYLLIATTLVLSSGGVALRSASGGTHALTAGASPSSPIVTATAEVHGPPLEAVLLAHEISLAGMDQCGNAEPTVRTIKVDAPGGEMALNSRGYNYTRPGEFRAEPVPAAPDKSAR